MSDRILVMSKGKLTGEFSGTEANEEKLVAASAVGHGPHETVTVERKNDPTSSAA
jgi:erythritol transport system ATP-binding protein